MLGHVCCERGGRGGVPWYLHSYNGWILMPEQLSPPRAAVVAVAGGLRNRERLRCLHSASRCTPCAPAPVHTSQVAISATLSAHQFVHTRFIRRRSPSLRRCRHTSMCILDSYGWRQYINPLPAAVYPQILKAGSRPSLTTIKSVIRSKSKLSQIAVESRSRLRASSRVNYEGDEADGDEWLQAKDPVKPHDQVQPRPVFALIRNQLGKSLTVGSQRVRRA